MQSKQSRVLCMAGGIITGAHGFGLSVLRWQVSAMLASGQACCRWSSCNQSVAPVLASGWLYCRWSSSGLLRY